MPSRAQTVAGRIVGELMQNFPELVADRLRREIAAYEGKQRIMAAHLQQQGEVISQ